MLQRLVLFVVTCSLAVGCGGGGSAGPAPGSVPPNLVAGTGSAVVLLPFGGVLTSEVVLTTSAGLRFVMPVGTGLRTTRGARISGPVVIGVDDAGGTGVWPGVPGLLGTARVYVLLGPAGAEVPTPVHFDPPALIEAPMVLPGEGGSFEVFTWQGPDGNFLLGGPPGGPADSAGAGPVGLGFARVELEGSFAATDVRNTGVYGFRYHAPVDAPAPKPTSLVDTELHEVEIPASKDGIKIKSVHVISKTGQIVHVMNATHGLDTGEGRARSGPEETWIVSIAMHDGKRFVQVRTNFMNKFTIRVDYCEDPVSVYTDTDGGSDDELDEEAEYTGSIRILVVGWGGFLDYISLYEAIRTSLGIDQYAISLRRFLTTGEGGYVALLCLHDTPASTQSVIDLLPPEWSYVASDRQITITTPCPPPTVVTATPSDPVNNMGAAAVNVLDLTTLLPISNIELDAGAPMTDLVVDPTGTQAVVVTDALFGVDLGGGSATPPLGFAGETTQAVGLSATQEALFVVLDTGRFVSLNPQTFALNWEIDNLGAGVYSALCTSTDGAQAATFNVTTGTLTLIDLLRHAQGQQVVFGPGAPGFMGFSHDGDTLAVTDPAGTGIHVIDLSSGSMAAAVAGGVQASACRFSPDDQMIVVADIGANTVSFVAPGSGLTLGAVTLGFNPQSLAIYVDGLGQPFGLAVGNTAIQRFPLAPGATPDLPQALPPGTEIVRCNGQ